MAKTVWISGASRGIGKSAAVHFARAGYKIAAGYHENDAAMQSLMQQLAEIGAMAVPVKGDIADPAAVESMAEYICSTLGGIDVLIANAGVAHYSMLEDMAYNEWRRVIDTDLTGVYNMIHASPPVNAQPRRRKHNKRILCLGYIRRLMRSGVFGGKGGRNRPYKGA